MRVGLDKRLYQRYCIFCTFIVKATTNGLRETYGKIPSLNPSFGRVKFREKSCILYIYPQERN